MEKFEIRLDNNGAGFYSGEKVHGNIILSCTNYTRFKEIFCEIKGEATVRCARRARNLLIQSHEEERADEEVYTSQKCALYEEQIGDEKPFSPGEHAFPFTFNLPVDVPSSFEGRHGSIRYTIRAVMKKPCSWQRATFKCIKVICPLDLNKKISAVIPTREVTSHEFSCLWCTSGPVKIELSLPAGAATPGEMMWPTLVVNNKSRVTINNIDLRLIQHVTYFKAKGRKITDARTVARAELGRVSSNALREFERVALKVPPMLPTGLENCNIIELRYYLEAKFIPRGWHCCFRVKVPILVGNIRCNRPLLNSKNLRLFVGK